MTIQFTETFHDLNKLQRFDKTNTSENLLSNKIEFKNYIFSSICKIDDTQQIAVVDEKQNEILLFSDQFDYLKSIKCINDSNVQLSHPERIYYVNGSVYLIQRNMHQLFELDVKMQKIKKLIRKNGEIYDSNNYPLDIYINSNGIYILMLRASSTSLQIFDLSGEFQNEVKLSKLDSNNNKKLRLKVNNDIVIVYNDLKIYIYDTSSSTGLLKHSIQVNNLSNCCFIENYLVIHTTDGIVLVYESSKQTAFEKYFYNNLISKHKLHGCNQKSSFIEYINDNLMLYLPNDNSLAIIDF